MSGRLLRNDLITVWKSFHPVLMLSSVVEIVNITTLESRLDRSLGVNFFQTERVNGQFPVCSLEMLTYYGSL